MKSVSKGKQLTINLATAIISYGLSLLVGFFLSPFVIEHIGVEANGFIALANNLVGYASLLTIALNSMASRYITIEIERKQIHKANVYFNSVLGANIFTVALLVVIGLPCILLLEKLIVIPVNLISDVKILFALIFINFVVSVIMSTFAVSTFATNRLYLTNLRTAESHFVRVAVLIGLFSMLKARVLYVGIATVLASTYILVFSIYYYKQLLPQIRIDKRYFSTQAVIEVTMSGIWNTITRLGQILLNGMDMLFANILIGPTAMGVLSLAKVLPQAIIGLVGTMANVFTPDITIDYAQNNISGIIRTVKRSMKIMASLVNVPIIVIIVTGDQFFRLWVPTQNADQLHLLSILALSCLVVSGGVNVVYNIFTVVNKLKLNSLTVVINGVISTIVVLILLKNSSLGLIAIVAVSEIVGLIRVLGFAVPYGAKCLGQKWYTFYPEALKPLLPAILCAGIGYGLKQFITVSSWYSYVIFSVLIAAIAFASNFLIILNKSDRASVMNTIMRLIKAH